MEKNLKVTLTVFLSAFIVLVLNGFLIYSSTEANAVEDEANTISEQGNVNLREISMAHTLKIEPDMPIDASEDFISSEITDVQLQVYTKYINNIKGVKRNSNRELTESEGLRKLKLRDRYIYDNIRPKNLLSFSESESEFFLDLDNDFIHYPNRELTDEELLQLIDFEKKINYILSLNDEKVVPSIKDISKSEAVTKATKSVEKLFDVDTGKIEITASYLETGPAKRAICYYIVTFLYPDKLLKNFSYISNK